VACRAALFAGILRDATWITRRSVQPFSVPVLGQAHNPRRLVSHDDDSEVRSCTYPCATGLDGIRWWIQRDRLSGPLHGVASQSPPWDVCITPASGGEELHLYSTQVIQDLCGLDPSSPASWPFRGNGSQLPLVVGLPHRRVLCVIRLPRHRQRAFPLTVLLRLPGAWALAELRFQHWSVSGVPLPCLRSSIPSSPTFHPQKLPGPLTCFTVSFPACYGLRTPADLPPLPRRGIWCCLRCALQPSASAIRKDASTAGEKLGARISNKSL
jgi:hypothetical protein